MRNNMFRVLLMSSILIFSSLAGCLGGDSSEDDSTTNGVNQLGKVLVSTYHVEQLVSAVAGDLVEVNMIAPTNTPVHDYEPTTQDLTKFNDVELFFYHGLNLEPWVGKTLSSLGSDAPKAVETHSMPTGYSDLEYKTILTDTLCELLSTDSKDEKVILHGAGEIHSEHEAFHFAFPGVSLEAFHERDHEEHDHENESRDDHEGHDHGDEDDNHEGHDHENETRDDHEGHDHDERKPLVAEDKISNPNGCDSGTSVSIYHLEPGEYVLEFNHESRADFSLAVVQMLGAHNHDHEGEGNHTADEREENQTADAQNRGKCHDLTTHENHDEYRTKEACENAGHMWMEISGEGACHDTTTHENHDEYTTKEECENAGHEWMGEDHEMTAERALQEFDANNDSKLSLDEIMDAFEDEHHHEEHAHEGHEHSNESSDDHEGHDHGDEEDNHEGHDHGDEEDNHEAEEEMMVREAFNLSDADDDGHLSLEELEIFIFLVDDRGTSVMIHIEEEGEYGFALPDSVNMTIEGKSGEHHDHEGHNHGGGDSSNSDNNDEQNEITAGEDEDAFEFDPHSWLNPLAFKAQIDIVLENLTMAFPQGEDTFKSNADAYKSELDAIDNKFESAFGSSGTCTDKTVIANHNAYSYMAYRYDLEFITIHGLDPEGEPSVEDIAKVIEEIEEKGLTVLFVEEYTNTDSLESLKQQTVSESMPDGIQIMTLYTMEMPPKDNNDDYLSLMQKNLDNLKSGLQCA